MSTIVPDENEIRRYLSELLEIPSPSGRTDQVVRYVCNELAKLNIPFELTRRGAIRATIEGHSPGPDRAVVAHLDTLGAMVKNLKDNGRLEIAMIGHWSARFAEGARVTIFTDQHSYRGTILPLKASGHTFNTEIDTQPVSWANLEIRIDERVKSKSDLVELGFNVGDFVAIDPRPELLENGFINSRHLDNKAGVACLLAAAKAIAEIQPQLVGNLYFLFTISEEVGSGASAILHGNIAEMVAIDNATPAPGQNSSEYGVTIAMKDSTGPFDYHLTHHLIGLCQEHTIEHSRDAFNYYRCDAAAAIEAGNDIRVALICFGVDASHGYERVHMDSLIALTRLIGAYSLAEPMFKREEQLLSPLKGFPRQPVS